MVSLSFGLSKMPPGQVVPPQVVSMPPDYPHYLSMQSNGDPGDGFYTDASHPAQGNSSPALTYGQTGPGLPIQWFDHAIVQLSSGTSGATPVTGTDASTVYDPSYGYAAQNSTIAASELLWETYSIPQYWSLYANDNGDPTFASATPATIQSGLQQRVQNGARINPNPPYVTFTYDKHPQQ